MDVSAFLSLRSLAGMLDNIKRRNSFGLTQLDTNQIDDFIQVVNSIKEFLERLPPGAWRNIKTQIGKIPDIVSVAKNTIDRHVIGQLIRARDEEPADKGLSFFRKDMAPVLEDMRKMKMELDSIQVESMENIPRTLPSTNTGEIDFKEVSIKTEGVMDEPFNKLMDKLFIHERKLMVIPIVGMGGSGKTTLAKCVYDDPSTIKRFDKRIWCTVSQNRDLISILQEAVGDKHKEIRDIKELGEKLHHMLYGRRYLVVMDDIWTTEIYEELLVRFQDGNNHSRIIVTIRDSEVASLSSGNLIHMKLLDYDKSWELLHYKVFGDDDCPSHLVEIGKDIAERCEGLPLSISAIAGLLFASDRSVEYWRYVKENVLRLVSSDEYGNCLKILSFSYDSLPLHLKSYFLHLGTYDKDSDDLYTIIIIEEWIKASLFNTTDGIDIHEKGIEYLKILSDRNLFSVDLSFWQGLELSIFKMHDLVRELCVREGMWEFFPNNNIWKAKLCKFCYHITELSIPFATSSEKPFLDMCNGCLTHQVRTLEFVESVDSCSICLGITNTKLTSQSGDCYCGTQSLHFHVADEIINFLYSGQDMSELKYPLAISFFWNVISLNDLTDLAHEMGQLQMCSLISARVDFRALDSLSKAPLALDSLIALESNELKCMPQLFETIPNLKTLGITFQEIPQGQSLHCPQNYSSWNQLSELILNCPSLDDLNIKFPKSLKDLALENCNLLLSGFEKLVGELSNLTSLVLDNCRGGSQWRFDEVELSQLVFLGLNCCDLITLKVKASTFPKLKTLFLVDMSLLKAIPSDIGNITTLQLIFIENCRDGVVESAKRIWRYHRTTGNDTFTLYLSGLGFEYRDDDYEGVWELEEDEEDDDYEEVLQLERGEEEDEVASISLG